MRFIDIFRREEEIKVKQTDNNKSFSKKDISSEVSAIIESIPEEQKYLALEIVNNIELSLREDYLDILRVVANTTPRINQFFAYNTATYYDVIDSNRALDVVKIASRTPEEYQDKMWDIILLLISNDKEIDSTIDRLLNMSFDEEVTIVEEIISEIGESLNNNNNKKR